VFPDVKETMPTHLAAADVGGKLLLVWRAGTVGGLRMRLAPQEHIEEPADAVVYDDLTANGETSPTSTLLGWELLARGDYALVVIATTSGVHVLRIDAAGKVTPLKVTWAT
jgi:hypothetical protein